MLEPEYTDYMKSASILYVPLLFIPNTNIVGGSHREGGVRGLCQGCSELRGLTGALDRWPPTAALHGGLCLRGVLTSCEILA